MVLPAGFDLEGTAQALGAFQRARGIKVAASLLRLALAYGGSDLLVRETSAWAEAAGVAQMSDMALQKRLRHADGWLGGIYARLIVALLAEQACGPRPAFPSASQGQVPSAQAMPAQDKAPCRLSI